MLTRVILVCALCAYRALTIEKARQLLEAAMQYAGHRRAVEKALDEGRSGGGDGGGGEVGVPAGWSAAAAIKKLEGAICKGDGKRGSALLPLETLAAARAEVAELKALLPKERAAAEKLAEERKGEAKQRAVEEARPVLLATSCYVLTMCLTACVRYAPCTYYVLAVQTAKLVSCHAHAMHAC